MTHRSHDSRASLSKLPLYSNSSAASSSGCLLPESEKPASSQQASTERRGQLMRSLPSSAVHRAIGLLSAQTAHLNRRRVWPLLVLATVSLVLLTSSNSLSSGHAASEERPSTPSSASTSAQQHDGPQGLRAATADWVDRIFRRPSQSLPKPSTSYITGSTEYEDDDFDRIFRQKQSSNSGKKQRVWKSPTAALPVDATLHERLKDLWDAPLDEPANWVKFNLETCSRERVKQTQNDWLTQDAAYTWHSLNSSDIREKRKGMIDYLVQAERNGLLDPARAGHGRGLVFTAGNADTFSRVLMTMKLLKKFYNTTLPAEVFSFPGEMPPDDLLPRFKEYNVTLRYINDASRDESRTKNYQIKSDAIVASSFAEVLYLDSDNMPAAYLGNHDGTWDPSLTTEKGLIWNAPAYKRLGAMFWPDYWKTGPMNPIWGIIGTQCRDEWEQEAGQILIDKRRHMDALLLSNWMLDDWQFWFRLSDGDKDIFRFAFLALRKRWAVPGRYVGAGALPGNSMTGFCGHTMMQHDHLGYPMFIHANLLKQIPSGVGRGFTWGRTRQTGLFNGGDPLVEGGEGSGDVEADQLANAAADGTAMLPAVTGVRYRAAYERGLYTRFHGGSTSALCVDLHFEDPRTKAEKAADLAYEKAHPRKKAKPEVQENKKEEGDHTQEKAESEFEESKGMITYGKGIDGEEIEINWDVSPVIIGYWRDEPRLKDFEQHFYDEGGQPNGSGFV